MSGITKANIVPVELPVPDYSMFEYATLQYSANDPVMPKSEALKIENFLKDWLKDIDEAANKMRIETIRTWNDRICTIVPVRELRRTSWLIRDIK